MQSIPVRLTHSSYDILVGAGVAVEVEKHLSQAGLCEPFLVISQPRILKAVGKSLKKRFPVVSIPDGERAKSLTTISRLLDRMVQLKLPRQSTVIAFGGGVVGDVAGFVAATYMRGLPLVQIPTSLLAMVDSSVGGKTAVNHKLGKNLIGAFYPPQAVFTDTTLLQSLPEREYLCGLSEIVKAGVIGDPALFQFIEEHIEAIRQREETVLTTLIERAIAVKVRVVQEDPTERGVRAILNFGHTLGHALEAATLYTQYSHGEAVAVGMALVAILSERLGFCSAAVRSRLCALIETLGLPTTYTSLPPQRLLAAMTHDKKSLNGIVRFILLKDIGEVAYHQQVPLEALQTLLAAYA